MKNLILSLLGLLIINCTFAQNGGQAPENGNIKLSYVGQIGPDYFGKIENKNTCEITVAVNQSNNTVVIPANGSYLFNMGSNIVNFKAKTESGCQGPDNGWVEWKISMLPLKFTSFNIERINDTDCYVIFEVAEVLNVRSIDIKVSIDGKIYKLFATLKPNQTYYKERLNLGTFVKTGLTPLEPKQ